MDVFEKEKMRDNLEKLDVSLEVLRDETADKGSSDEMLLLERLKENYYVIPRKPFEDIEGQFNREIEKENAELQELKRELSEKKEKLKKLQKEYDKNPASGMEVKISLLKTDISSLVVGIDLWEQSLETLEEGRRILYKQ